jgi:hypothetical protein
MNNRSKISFGFSCVVLLFFVAYATFLALRGLPVFSRQSNVVNQLGQELNGFNQDPKSIGQSGGFHSMQGVRLEETDNYYRIVIATFLNRSVVDNNLLIPATKAELVSTTFNDPKVKIEAINVTMADTNSLNVNGFTTQPMTVLLDINKGPFTVVYLNSENAENLQVAIGLKNKVGFRLQDDPAKGEIYVDVAK